MPRPVRVLQLASPSGLYGAERWILALIRNLDPQKIESSVATVNDTPLDTGPICVEASQLGFRSFALDAPGRFNFSAITRLARLLREEHIDIVHTHGYKMDFLGLLAGRMAGCHTVTTIHGWTDKPNGALRLYEAADRLLFMFFSAVVALSPDLYCSSQRNPLLRKRLSMIMNGVDLTEVCKAGQVPSELTSLKRAGKVILGFIGRLVPGKGVDCLVHALARHGAPDWHLVVVGSGPSEACLRKLAASLKVTDRIDFLGFRSDRLEVLKGFDVFVLPSLSEGTPRSVMEAMAIGVPVVASNIPGCRNLIRHRETGILFAPGIPNALAEGVRLLISDTNLISRIRLAAALQVSEQFSARRMATDYEKLFLSLADKASGSKAEGTS